MHFPEKPQSTIDALENLPTLSYKEHVESLGRLCISVGAIDPETEKAYGLDENTELDLSGSFIEKSYDIGEQAMAIVALFRFFGADIREPSSMPSEFIQNSLTITHPTVNPESSAIINVGELSGAASYYAMEWGVEKIIESLNSGPNSLPLKNGETALERLDELTEYDSRAQDELGSNPLRRAESPKRLKEQLRTVFDILGRKDLFYKKHKLPPDTSNRFLVQAQEVPGSQCVTFTALASYALGRLKIPYEQANGGKHTFLSILDDTKSIYDGGADGVIVKKFPKMVHGIRHHHTSKSRLAYPISATKNNLGVLLWQADHKKEAEVEVARAIQLDEGNADAWLNYGTSRSKDGDFENAAIFLQRAVDLNPTSLSYRKELMLNTIRRRVSKSRS